MYTLDQYNALCSAIALGATTVKYGDKEITYRSLDDMNKLKQTMESKLFPSQAQQSQTNRRKFAQYGRGFDN